MTGRCTRKVPTTTVQGKRTTIIYMAMQIQREKDTFSSDLVDILLIK